MLGFHNPNPASVAGTVWLDLRSCSAASSVDPRTYEATSFVDPHS